MVDDSDINSKLLEIAQAENTLLEKLDNIRKSKQALELIRMVEQKELLSGSEEEGNAVYQTHSFKKIDPNTLEVITDARRDEIYTKISKNLILE